MATPKVTHRYPRRGERVAPRTLRQFLLDPIPPRLQAKGDHAFRKLCDLDETAWDRFAPPVVDELAQLIVERVGACHARRAFQHWHFPRPPAGIRLEDLPLENRTRRCLSRQGIDDSLESLGDRTIGEILSIRAFGPRCLVDLLTALEAPQRGGTSLGAGGINRAGLSEELTAAAETLAALTESTSVRQDDPRFAPWMQAVDAEARTALELAERLRARRQDPPDPAYVTEQVRQLCQRVRALSGRTLEQELSDIFAANPHDRNARILIGYYGWEDGRSHTLTEIGQRFGITRERVRQVCAKFTKKLPSVSALPAPAMDRALRLIAERLPCSAARLEAELIEQGLTAVGMSIEALIAGARLLGRPVRFKVLKIDREKGTDPTSTTANSSLPLPNAPPLPWRGEERPQELHGRRTIAKPDGERQLAADQDENETSSASASVAPPASALSDGRLMLRPDQLDAALAAVDLAKKEVYFHGLATVARIAEGIAAEKTASEPTGGDGPEGASHKLPPSPASRGRQAREDVVRQTLMLMDGFCWLDEATGWFRLLHIDKHGLPKAIDKVLAVAGAVTAAQLGAALARNRRLWKSPPPENVLLAFCSQMPRVRVEGTRIISDPPRDWRKALTGVEAQLVEVLKTHGPVMERGAMEDLCVAGGMNRFSFHAFISWSPVITQCGHSLYGLLGSEASPQQMERFRDERLASRLNHRVLDRHGQTDDGKVWLRYHLSKAASTYAVITVPAALKKVVRGRFQLLAPDGGAIGVLATKDGRAWGLGAFLREHGARIGDHILLTLDLEQRTAVVSWEEKGRADEGREIELRPR